ncbi:unnamed protein product [Gongylonema pulchrum]|uniref:General transcription factor IIH subunit 4 n=1 Tax=Gongylonema pulchrum TaxID=637853 RepID=A0A3P7LQX8_9BILA|nr:unnamed protein product [Gongylonema pulchrum]
MMSIWEHRPLLEYMSSRPAEQLNQLYSSPAVAFALFRFLPELAQEFFLKALWLKDVGNKWYPVYRHSYLRAIRMGLYRASKLDVVTDCDEKTRKSANKDLGKKASERWECILHYLALPSQKSEQGVSSTTKMLFRTAGLTSYDEEQIWTYLLHYFHMQEATGNDITAEIEFLLRLTLCVGSTSSNIGNNHGSGDKERQSSSGRAFRIDETWSEPVKGFLMHLRELGLIFIRKRKDGFFFLTPLLNHLTNTSDTSEMSLEKRNQNGFIVVETNYRVYAYTSSSLQLAILSTFTEMLYR